MADAVREGCSQARTVTVARSPIAPAPPEAVVAGWLVSGRRSNADLTVTDCTSMAEVVLRGPLDGELARSFDVPLGRAARQVWGDVEVLLVGRRPGEWLGIGPPGAQAVLVDRLRRAAAAAATGELVTVLDLTHGRALIRVTGARSAELLAAECALDLTDPACPDGTAWCTAVARVACDVIRDDQAGVRSYLVGCERSVGQYLFDALLDSGAELGADVDGFWEDGHAR